MTIFSLYNSHSRCRRLNLIPKKGQLRGQFSYNNLMYGLAGMAAEAIGGKPYFELMREKLFEPLNITTAVMVDNLDYGQTLTSKPHQMINGSVKRSDVRFYRYSNSYQRYVLFTDMRERGLMPCLFHFKKEIFYFFNSVKKHF